MSAAWLSPPSTILKMVGRNRRHGGDGSETHELQTAAIAMAGPGLMAFVPTTVAIALGASAAPFTTVAPSVRTTMGRYRIAMSAPTNALNHSSCRFPPHPIAQDKALGAMIVMKCQDWATKRSSLGKIARRTKASAECIRQEKRRRPRGAGGAGIEQNAASAIETLLYGIGNAARIKAEVVQQQLVRGALGHRRVGDAQRQRRDGGSLTASSFQHAFAHAAGNDAALHRHDELRLRRAGDPSSTSSGLTQRMSTTRVDAAHGGAPPLPWRATPCVRTRMATSSPSRITRPPLPARAARQAARRLRPPRADSPDMAKGPPSSSAMQRMHELASSEGQVPAYAGSCACGEISAVVGGAVTPPTMPARSMANTTSNSAGRC